MLPLYACSAGPVGSVRTQKAVEGGGGKLLIHQSATNHILRVSVSGN
jgi:hypothetical protein